MYRARSCFILTDYDAASASMSLERRSSGIGPVHGIDNLGRLPLGVFSVGKSAPQTNCICTPAARNLT